MSTDGLIVLEDATGSPVSRVKFLCSHGGKILPRPIDGQLKYVGGETRVISVPRDIKFSELLKKLTFYIEEEMILKYQLLPEELDALVSVRNNEDLQHMFNEHDLYETAGSPRLRSFLFPAKPVLLEIQAEALAIEQRYIDAINGVVRPPLSSPALSKSNYQAPSVINSFHGALGMSSACSSPQSPDSCNNMEGGGSSHEGGPQNSHHGGAARSNLHRVHSSPSVGNLVSLQQGLPCGHSHQQQQQYPQNYYHTVRAQNQNQHQNQNPHQNQNQHQGQGQYPSRPPTGGPGPERLISVRSVGRAEGGRYQVDYTPPPAPSQLQSSAPRYNISSNRGGYCPNSKCMPSDEYNNGHSFDRRGERSSSMSPSPISLSPQYSYLVGRHWDAAVAGNS